MVRNGRRIPSLSDCPFCLLLAVCLSVCWRDEWTHAPHRSFLLVPLGSPVRSWHLGFERLLSGSCKKTAPSLAENVTVACGVQCKVRGSQVVAEPSFSLSQFPTRPCHRRKTTYHPYPPPLSLWWEVIPNPAPEPKPHVSFSHSSFYILALGTVPCPPILH